MAYSGYFEFTISQIDNGYQKIFDFDDETLFMNIYHFWCFSKYLSPYYRWGIKALKNLKRNIKRKWSKDFTNVNYLFIELVNQELKEVDPSNYFFNSENYFTKLMFAKPIMDLMIRNRHLSKEKMKKNLVDFKIRKCIR